MSARIDQRTESELIAAILSGDIELYHELIRPHERRVYVMALSFMKNKEDAEDAVQETFIRALRNLGAFRGDSRFGTWLISIALNEARDRLRRRAAARVVPLHEPWSGESPVSPAMLRDWRELPSETVERKAVRRLIEPAVRTLPEIY